MTLAEQSPQVSPWLRLSELDTTHGSSEIHQALFDAKLDQLAQNGIDLVWFLDGHWHLLDTHPAWDGNGSHKRLAEKIKAIAPDTKVILYSIYPGYKNEARLAGADFFMIKGSPESTPAEIILSFFPPEKAVPA